jgi:peptide/nickel transport system ATP-binding protein
MTKTLLSINNLSVEAKSSTEVVQAVNGACLDINEGEIVGLIGESGSGKTTLIRSILDLHERNVRVVSGSMVFKDIECYNFEKQVNSLPLMRGKNVGMVFQSPRASLNPLMSIGSQLREVLKKHSPDVTRDEVRLRTIQVLDEMGLDSERVSRSYPHQLSGGMCQRASIAIAIVVQPELIITDECTSALDVTSQAEVVNVLKKLTISHQTAMLFVTHDILLASELCHRVIVMQNGVIVEGGETSKVLTDPSHPYTRGLISAVPRWG